MTLEEDRCVPGKSDHVAKRAISIFKRDPIKHRVRSNYKLGSSVSGRASSTSSNNSNFISYSLADFTTFAFGGIID